MQITSNSLSVEQGTQSTGISTTKVTAGATFNALLSKQLEAAKASPTKPKIASPMVE